MSKHRIFGTIDNILDHGSLTRRAVKEYVKSMAEYNARIISEEIFEAATVSAFRKVSLLLVKGLIEYAEIVGEVIIEMTFDSLLSYDEGARPVGGASVFLAVMTVSVLTSAALGSGNWGYDGNVRLARDWTGLARVGLTALMISLTFSQVAMRMPVLAANAA